MKLKLLLFTFSLIGIIVFSQETYVPDDNFEAYLETHDALGNLVTVGNASSMGNGIADDNTVTSSKISSVTSLGIYGRSISDLTGIEDFLGLTELYCYKNQLTNLDVSKNTNLKALYCYDNQLTQLVVSNNTDLMTLYCYDNQLTELDVSNNTNLKALYCYDNQLIELDISNNTSLTELSSGINKLTGLDVSKNTSLTKLFCYDNQLTELDVSNNTSLTKLSCHINKLESLNVKNGNNINFQLFNSANNPTLSCIVVDNASWSTTNWGNIDTASTFVNTQAECTALDLVKTKILSFTIHPNPSKGSITVHVLENSNLTIYSALGKTVLKKTINVGENQLNNLNLSKGLYFVKVTNSKETLITKKLIIQ